MHRFWYQKRQGTLKKKKERKDITSYKVYKTKYILKNFNYDFKVANWIKNFASKKKKK